MKELLDRSLARLRAVLSYEDEILLDWLLFSVSSAPVAVDAALLETQKALMGEANKVIEDREAEINGFKDFEHELCLILGPERVTSREQAIEEIKRLQNLNESAAQELDLNVEVMRKANKCIAERDAEIERLRGGVIEVTLPEEMHVPPKRVAKAPRKHGGGYPRTPEQPILDAYAAGNSTKYVSTKLGISEATVIRCLNRNNVVRRPRLGAKAPEPAPVVERLDTAKPIKMSAEMANGLVSFIRAAANPLNSFADLCAATGLTSDECLKMQVRFAEDIKFVKSFRKEETVQAYLDVQRKDLMEKGCTKHEKPL